MKYLALNIFLLSLLSTSIAQESPIQWMSIEEAYKAYEKEARPMYIDVYTDWCGWCKRMDKTTFMDPELAAYLNNYFYPVKLNAETKESIDFNGKRYVNSQHKKGRSMIDSLTKTKENLEAKVKTGNPENESELQAQIQENQNKINQLKRKLRRTSHDFAVDLLRGQMSYPTSIFLFDSLKNNMPAKGALAAEQILALSVFIAEGVYTGTRDVNQFSKLFTESKGQKVEKVNWMDFEEALKKQKENGKKLFVHIVHPGSRASETMLKGTMEKDAVAQNLNNEFNPVLLNVNDEKSYEFRGKTFTTKQGYNELALALLDGEQKFPFFCVIDENGQLVMKIPQFFFPNDLNNVLEFIYTDAFKQSNYPEWIKNKSSAKAD